MDLIAKYLGKMSMYMGMLLFLCGLLGAAAVLAVLGMVPYSPLDILLQAVFFVTACWVVNFLIARFLDVRINFESAVITGLILAAIMGPLSLPSQWLILLFASFAAMVSKYILTVNKMHIFNPAAFGAVASALALGYPASWWIGISRMIPILIAGGLVVVLKIRYFRLLAGFFATYAALYAGYFGLVQGVSAGDALAQAQTFAFSAPVLFFAFVMLVEPLTAPGTKMRRVYFGVFVAATLFTLQVFVPQVSYSLGGSLLAGNLLALAMKRNMRQVLTLKGREIPAPDIESMWFKPEKPFRFYPGQYVEYTLQHSRPDARGMRRFFTIASSPTEEEILLTTRFFEKSSSFKRKLMSMKEGDKVVAAKVSGDFVPPPDVSKKLVFMAGGIGITPFRSMVKYFIDKGEERDVTLLYGVSKKEDAIFTDIFEEAKKRFGMKSVYSEGRISEELIRKEISDPAESIFYISGPDPMVRSMERILAKMKVPSGHIKRDYFPGYE